MPQVSEQPAYFSSSSRTDLWQGISKAWQFRSPSCNIIILWLVLLPIAEHESDNFFSLKCLPINKCRHFRRPVSTTVYASFSTQECFSSADVKVHEKNASGWPLRAIACLQRRACSKQICTNDLFLQIVESVYLFCLQRETVGYC